MNHIPASLVDFLEREYPQVHTWIHENDRFSASAEDRCLSIAFKHEGELLTTDQQNFLYNFFPKIRAWVHKNDEIVQNLNTGGKYHSRPMQVGFEDFLVLEGML